MTYFANIDDNDIVTKVIIADQQFVDNLDGFWKSDPSDRVGIGYIYDVETSTFHPPKPNILWVWDDKTNSWLISEIQAEEILERLQ